ncbi:vitamin K epoxide reductase family protein [Alloacidobacterium dinghuense]|uniref:Vitamin K epoxide reductase family protein n=1 Tax=Alloacidobacterium dinghuense TaxID=2763107 RepID=A0A7G8BIV9_9BACT|nr:vitamin K epoxide reductase family protein [Alloacidobacterium dinghuense]QNI32479.1 vitamin K epoxide reductase family protein [Alloacidobacterium dinghuense]
MRYLVALLAVAGVIVAVLALRIHYSMDAPPCDINAHWDCGIVNHSRYSVMLGIPVATIGIVGYVVIAILALFRRYRLLLVTALAGLAFTLYLTSIEARILQTWCLYCVISQGIMAFIALLSIAVAISSRKTTA